MLAYLYAKYRKLSLLQGILKALRPTVVAMILAAGLAILIPALFRTGSISFGQQSFDVRAAILFTLAFVLLRWKKPNPILVMLGCGLTEGIIQIISMYTT